MPCLLVDDCDQGIVEWRESRDSERLSAIAGGEQGAHSLRPIRRPQSVNKELIGLYLDIGGLIAARRQGSAWGKSIVEQLARDLHAEFPGIQGFSTRNIW
jgi:hypothetical protein